MYDVVFRYYSDLISHTYTHTHTHTHAHAHTRRQIAHTDANGLTHPYKYMLTLPVMCSKQLPVLNWMNNFVASKIYILEFHDVFAFEKLLTCKNHKSVDKIQ